MRGACVISPGGWRGMGGIQTYARSIARRLAAHPDCRTVKLLDPRGPHVLVSPFYLLSCCLRLTFLALTGRVDVAHLQVSERASFVRKGVLVALARALGLRTVLHHHGAELRPFVETCPPAMKRIVRGTVRMADVNLVLGEDWRDVLIHQLGVAPERARILYNGLDDIMDGPEEPRRGPVRILFLAVMIQRKGARVLIEALTRLKHRRVEVVIAGGGPDLALCRAYAERLGVAHLCVFAGAVRRRQATRLMQSADMFVCPSYHEGLPLTVLEAMRAGKPVICTPVGAIPEAIEELGCATFVPVGDSAALAAAMDALIRDSDLRRARGAAARAGFEERFLLDRHLDQLLTQYGWRTPEAMTQKGPRHALA